MKKLFASLCVIMSFGAIAQTKNIQGTYYYNALTEDLILKMHEDKTFDIVLLSGKYELGKDNNINFMFGNISNFIVKEKEKGNKKTLTINLKSNYANSGLKFLYVGYEDENKQVKYENLYNIITSTEEAKEEIYPESQETIYSLGTFEIPKTENLYLVNAIATLDLSTSKKVIIEKYPIKKDVSSVDVLFSFSGLYKTTPKIIGTYDEKQQSIRLNDLYDGGITSFTKKSRYDDEKNITKISTDEVQNWKHLVSFKEDEFKSDSLSSSVETKVKLDIKNNLADALKSAKNHNKLLFVFYQPENTEKAKKEFDELIAQYESDLSYYSEYDFAKYDVADFYFADKKDEKWFKKKNIKTENQFICLDDNGEILYHEPNTMSNIKSNIYAGSSLISAMEGAFLAKKIDDVFGNKKATISEIEGIFSKILTSSTIAPYLYKEKKNSDEQTASQDWDYYFENLKNIESLYKFKTTPEQTDKLWKKMMEAHKKDTQLAIPFAILLSNNYESYDLYFGGDYHQKVFGTERKIGKADLEAVRYLIKFNSEIQAHNESLSNVEIIDYTDSKTININGYNLTFILNKIAEDSPELRNEVKSAYVEGRKNNLFDYEDFKAFLEEFYPEQYLTFFEEYYQMMTSADASHIILSLDKMYSQSKRKEYENWVYYKSNFANDCNNVAWKIVEEHKSDKKLLEKALQWSKTSLELENENPYYLDTYAHLLYFTGNREKAIEMQRKALQLLNKNKGDYEQELKDTVTETLKKMENGSL
ncbi:hypothetical protein [Capnocytophaga felis]|nr:hypothetical protein [Capnocytophaga felis]